MAQADSNSTDLEDTFFLSGHPTKRYLLKLSPIGLSITSRTDQDDKHRIETITIDDIYGCLAMKSAQVSSECYLALYLYQLRRSQGIAGIFSKTRRMYRAERIFAYGSYNKYEENYAEVVRWQRMINEAIYQRRNLPREIVRTKRDKRALVFVNPAGGAGKAHRLVMQHCVGVWSEAQFEHHIIVTEYAGHARDFVRGLDLNEWSGIVVASGDGLVYEVINGLLSRDDWQEALTMPIGHLPCGSGNAFITSIIRHCKQPIPDSIEKFVVQAAILIATHQVLPFDMAIMDACDGQRIFSFLSLEWAMIADVDCDSEKYRYLGETRFTVEAVKRILRPRVYHGYIDYLPHNPDGGIAQINPIAPNASTAQLYQHLIPLNEPISIDSSTSQWRRIDGPFAHVLITSKPALSRDVLSTPNSTLADGYLTLQFIRGNDVSRVKLAKTFTSLTDGTHLDFDFVEHMPIRAFRIVPDGTEGNIMVDGEKVPYGPIQGEVLPNFARCMGKQPNQTQPE